MTYIIEYTDDCKREIKKAARRNNELQNALGSQIRKLMANPMQGKPLRAPLAGFWSVHVLGSFVFIYEIVEKDNKVILHSFAHHDEAYGR